MDSTNETANFNSSTKVSLTENQQPSSIRKRTRKYQNPRFIFCFLLIILTIIVCAIVLSSILRNKRSHPFDTYLFKKQYYCKLTAYRRLCFKSISSIVNTTALRSNPGLIFSASIQVAINELSNNTVTIEKALSFTANTSLADSSLHKCKTWVLDSLSQLNKSLTTLGVDCDVESLTYEEMDYMRSWNMAATNNALKCLLALQEKIEMMVEGEEKMGVEKARKYMINSRGLFDQRDSILFDFYNPLIEHDTFGSYFYYHKHAYGSSYFYYHDYSYTFLVCMYSALYLFVALLYFLFWRSG